MIHATPCGLLWPCHAKGEEEQGVDSRRWWGASRSAVRHPEAATVAHLGDADDL